MSRQFGQLFMFALIAAVAACSNKADESTGNNTSPDAGPVTALRLANAPTDPKNWLIHGRTYEETRYSSLTAISAATVANLGLEWHFDLTGPEGRQTSTPLAVDGTLYLTGNWSQVVALDAVTGKLIWQYDPQVPRSWAVNLCCGPVNRGVAFWDNKVYLATQDGRLIALDSRTGTPKWQTIVGDRSERSSLTGAPRVIKGKVFIGSGGSDFGVRGRLIAVDAETGAILWRFFTVPGNPALPQENIHLPEALGTWNGEWWKTGGGGAVWDAMSYDPTLDLLYIGTGNGAPWPRTARSPKGGDNLYVSSIIAMHPDTGIVVWHYQTTPGDEWGYDAASQMVLTDLTIAGTRRQVLMQAAANGFLYVLDRSNGVLISATPYVPVNWATGVDLGSGRPVENPEARYSERGKTFVASPGQRGAHSWQAMAYNPDTGLLYIPAMINSSELAVDIHAKPSRYASNSGVTAQPARNALADFSRLIAWNPVTGVAAWHIDSPTPTASGVLATGGSLVFEGNTDGLLQALDAKSGKTLWQFDTQGRLEAAPITYKVQSRQYIAIVAGTRGTQAGEAPRLLVFALSGNKKLPKAETLAKRTPPTSFGSTLQTLQGAKLYQRYCTRCHGSASEDSAAFLRLSDSPQLADKEQWRLTVFAGQLEQKGMPGFFAEIAQADAESIRAYVVEQANRPSNCTPTVPLSPDGRSVACEP